MSKNFIKAEYPANVIRSAFSKVFHTDRTTLLNPPQKEEDDNKNGEERTFLITTFHPNFRECNNIVQANWDILEKSSSTRPLLNLKLIKGKRRAKNYGTFWSEPDCLPSSTTLQLPLHIKLTYPLSGGLLEDTIT